MNDTQKLLLNMLAQSLFSAPTGEYELTPALIEEARAQSVYTFLPNLKETTYYAAISQNVQIHHQHRELHNILTASAVPYVILKGSASAKYYPEPMRRCAGDVDFLVREADFERAKKALLDNGFALENDGGGKHISFAGKSGITIEMHRHVNGENEKTAPLFSDIIEKAELYDGMMIPSAFHHGLVLLGHMASHFTQEGIGLRHLCDWAVFSAKADVSQWEPELKACGLWRFARVMSQLSARYLLLPEREWYGDDEENILPELMEDIFTSGNFGVKDLSNRRQQIKYISAENDRAMKQNVVLSAWKSLRAKAKKENKSIAAVLGEYLALLGRGERKLDTIATLQQAKHRKELYGKLGLFDNTQS